jgi:selenocysteine-specific elongation factor
MVLARPGVIAPALALDIRVRATKLISHPIVHNAGVTFLSATSESQARIRLLDRGELAAGEEGWAQLVLDTPVAVVAGDHCVIRTSNDTVAGGRIVAVNPKRHRLRDGPTLRALALRLEGTPADRLADLLGGGPLTKQELAAALNLPAQELEGVLSAAVADGRVTERDSRLYLTAWLDSAMERVEKAASEYLQSNPLRPAAPREHVRAATGLDPAVFDSVTAAAAVRGLLEERGAGLAPAGYEATLTPGQRRMVAEFLASLKAGGCSPPTDNLPEPSLLAYLAAAGQIEDTGAGVVFDSGVFDEMLALTKAHIEARGSISLAEVRDLLGTSRKYAQAFLEHLDNLKVTRRVGDARTLRHGARA